MKKNSSPAVQLKNVSKQYMLHHEKPTFVEQIVRTSKTEVFTAIDRVDLTINQGEKVGLIGPNGSGKTTILKMIAGISTPTQGEVFTNGKIVSLIDLEAGFHPDLTGEENVYLNGMLIGMRKREIQDRFNQIVEFAEIGQFIDSPLYTFSQGMKLRLGFSIIIFSDFNTLVIDEATAVGDERFKKKIVDKLNSFYRSNKTIILVTHDFAFLKENDIERVILLEKGKVKLQGSYQEVLPQYLS